RPWSEAIRAASGKVGKARLGDGALADVGDPVAHEPLRRGAIDPGARGAVETGRTETEREQKVVLGRKADAVLLLVVLMRTAVEAGALQLDHGGRVAAGEGGDKRAQIGAGRGRGGAEFVGIGTAEGVAGARLGVQQPEPRIMQAPRPARASQPAGLTPPHQ